MSRQWIACGSALGIVLISPTSAAQIHGDVDLEAGGESRFLTARPAAGPDASLGPTFLLSGHIAVLPLFRAGPYVAHDISRLAGVDTRQITTAGLSLRLLSPWPRGVYRAWFSASFGYASAYAPGYMETPHSESGPNPTAVVQGSQGDFFEIPLAIGASLRFARKWEFVAEAGARIGFDFTGSMYNPGPMVTSGAKGRTVVPPAGDDSLGVFLVVGIAFEL